MISNLKFQISNSFILRAPRNETLRALRQFHSVRTPAGRAAGALAGDGSVVGRQTHFESQHEAVGGVARGLFEFQLAGESLHARPRRGQRQAYPADARRLPSVGPLRRLIDELERP